MIAAYNAESTLGASLDSVLRQRYDRWEVVVVDDGSSDSTLEIARSYAQTDDRIRVISQANAGAGAARNAAIRMIDSDYIGYLDADDMLADEHMSAMLELMRESPGYDIYSSDGLFVHKDGSTELVFGYGERTCVSLDDMLRECRVLGGGALVRAEALRALGGFREHLYGEDYDLWLRALAAGFTNIATPEPLYIYHRCVPGQKSDDPNAGYDSAARALRDVVRSGLLTSDQEKLANASIEMYEVGPRLEAQALRLRSTVERVVGERLAEPTMKLIHSVTWITRPLRSVLARVRRWE